MIRPFTRYTLAAMACLAAAAAPAFAQLDARAQLHSAALVTSASQADLHGVVVDERGQPLPGAVVSALGVTTAFAVSDSGGRFAFRALPSGPYLVRAHLQGYLPARARLIRVDQSSPGISTIALTRRGSDDQPPQVLAAGMAPADVSSVAGGGDADEGHDHGEVAWRLRHLKRSVLKDTTTLTGLPDDDSGFEAPSRRLSRAVGTPARFAAALFGDLPLSGEFNLLTRTSFDRPQDLFSADAWLPRGVAFLTLEAPTGNGNWTMRGAITQGDLPSWILAGSYVREAPAAHRYQAGMSYGMQRYYLRGSAAALANNRRNVGAVHAYDQWAINSRLSVGYGAEYARYDYLTDSSLLSPRASVTVAPIARDSFKVRASFSRRALAPGVEEFIPPSTGLWLPPERTFSPVSARRGFTSEHVEHMEVAAERTWVGNVLIGVRAFRQNVDDQLVTLFGVAVPSAAEASGGHYYVGSGGDVDALGWGVSLSHEVAKGLRASVDYTQVDSTWIQRSPDAAALSRVASFMLRSGEERIHDLTTSVESIVPVTETRVFVVYKINTGFAEALADGAPAGARFDVQLNQSLPFLNFTSTQWEMLVEIRNLFREELVDSSVYDELLVLRPPKRIVGGVTVRF